MKYKIRKLLMSVFNLGTCHRALPHPDTVLPDVLDTSTVQSGAQANLIVQPDKLANQIQPKQMYWQTKYRPTRCTGKPDTDQPDVLAKQIYWPSGHLNRVQPDKLATCIMSSCLVKHLTESHQMCIIIIGYWISNTLEETCYIYFVCYQ